MSYIIKYDNNDYWLLYHYSRSGSSSQLIWSKYMCNTSFDTCYVTRNSCQLTSVTNISHSEDIAIECSM